MTHNIIIVHPPPFTTEQQDDFIVTSTGQVGIGTISPKNSAGSSDLTVTYEARGYVEANSTNSPAIFNMSIDGNDTWGKSIMFVQVHY